MYLYKRVFELPWRRAGKERIFLHLRLRLRLRFLSVARSPLFGVSTVSLTLGISKMFKVLCKLLQNKSLKEMIKEGINVEFCRNGLFGDTCSYAISTTLVSVWAANRASTMSWQCL